MDYSTLRRSIVGLGLVLTLGVGSAVAQDAPPAGTTVCDAELIMNLYIAERYFGFSGISGLMTAPDPSAVIDVNAYDKGQFSSLFTSSSGTQPAVTLSEEQMQGTAGIMQLDPSTMQTQIDTMQPAGTDLTAFTALPTVNVAGEDPLCTSLRTQLYNFYRVLAFQDMQMMAGGGVAPEATADAGSGSAIGGSNSTGSSISGNGGASSDNMPGTGAQNTPPPGGGSPGG